MKTAGTDAAVALRPLAATRSKQQLAGPGHTVTRSLPPGGQLGAHVTASERPSTTNFRSDQAAFVVHHQARRCDLASELSHDTGL